MSTCNTTQITMKNFNIHKDFNVHLVMWYESCWIKTSNDQLSFPQERWLRDRCHGFSS